MEAASIMSEFNATSGGMAGSVVYAYAFGEGRRSGGFALILCGAPVPRKQFMETVLGDVGDAREDVGEPSLRIDVVELCRADKAQH